MSGIHAPKESNDTKDGKGSQYFEHGVAAADNDGIGHGVSLLRVERGVRAIMVRPLVSSDLKQLL